MCSWDFYLEGEGHQATVEFNWLSEQGSITADGASFDVRKHGTLSGHWTLDHAGQEVASAQKSTPFTRTFELQSPIGTLVLCAESAFGRSFCLESSRYRLATISPKHAFTRRATIQTVEREFDFPIISFSFWLVVLTWRRAASQS
jgi:hypothetical protein